MLFTHTYTLSCSLCVSHVSQASQDQKLDCALDLMRRLPPQQIEKNLSDLIDLVRLYVCVCVCEPGFLKECDYAIVDNLQVVKLYDAFQFCACTCP